MDQTEAYEGSNLSLGILRPIQGKKFLVMKLFTTDRIFIANNNVNDGKKFSSIIKKFTMNKFFHRK